MTQTDSSYVIVGKVGATYGVKGWIKIISFTEMGANILEYNPWYLDDRDDWKKVIVQDSREHGKGLIVKFQGYETPEQAKVLSGKKIAILRSQLPKLAQNEYYWSDLKGLTVIDQHGKKLGTVIYLMETGANDVLVVKGEKEYAIPYLPDQVVIKIDLVEKVMYVNWDVI